MDAQESQRLVRGQKDRLDYEVRKFRRRRLVQYHDLEQDLLREVRLRMEMVRENLSDIIDFQELNKRQLQLESAHNMLLRHHEMTQVRHQTRIWSGMNIYEYLTQELETKQQKSVHGVRENQLTTQHRTELGNQVSSYRALLLSAWPRPSCHCHCP